MTASSNIWQQELQHLRDAGRQLSEAMSQAAVELREGGWEPTESLLQQMQQFRADFHRLRESAGKDRTGNLSPLESLDALEGEFIQREQIAAAVQRVNDAARLRTRTGDSAGPMFDRLHAEILAVKSDLSLTTPPEHLLDALQSGHHPLVVAVRLVRDADDLNDDDWGDAMQTVTTALGRDFATALARGRLTLHEELTETNTIH